MYELAAEIDHHSRRMFDGRCQGCYIFALYLQKFLLHANRCNQARMVHMGDWEDGWMKAIIEDPRKFIK